jgi:hypothetical protein
LDKFGGFILKNPKMNFKIISVCYDESNDKNETARLAKILPNIKTEALWFKG